MKYLFIVWGAISCVLAFIATTKDGLKMIIGFNGQEIVWSTPLEVAAFWPIFLIHLFFTAIMKVVRG